MKFRERKERNQTRLTKCRLYILLHECLITQLKQKMTFIKKIVIIKKAYTIIRR